MYASEMMETLNKLEASLMHIEIYTRIKLSQAEQFLHPDVNASVDSVLDGDNYDVKVGLEKVRI